SITAKLPASSGSKTSSICSRRPGGSTATVAEPASQGDQRERSTSAPSKVSSRSTAHLSPGSGLCSPPASGAPPGSSAPPPDGPSGAARHPAARRQVRGTARDGRDRDIAPDQG